ncbi:uncharacterized protein BKA55DRAFT_173585 [Fusarium redolens]|uniref:Uncharacterized protein n=1 Tax=Fusarium redolens TaxID=48865 RepID=A0A9P9KRP5_FUSRE|nr:uncharacterized protein BKA55DRAFT_173585 [Fusarium redolens]KAH7267298.1 hypothetical protein BKA55DRAFT_173585 [Fusarium redolens]
MANSTHFAQLMYITRPLIGLSQLRCASFSCDFTFQILIVIFYTMVFRIHMRWYLDKTSDEHRTNRLAIHAILIHLLYTSGSIQAFITYRVIYIIFYGRTCNPDDDI